MSGITLTDEFAVCAAVFGWTLDYMEWLTLNAAKSTFYEFSARLAMINTVIKPGYAALRALHASNESRFARTPLSSTAARARCSASAPLRGGVISM